MYNDKKQLILGLKFSKLNDWKDFYVSPANQDAVSWLQNFLSLKINALLIYGETKSGKSHLGSLWLKSINATLITEEMCRKNFVEEIISKNNCFLIDDSEIIKNSEEWFFYFFNSIILNENKNLKKVLILAKNPVVEWNLKLNDLKSRLISITSTKINPPDQALSEKLIKKFFFEYGIKYQKDYIPKILTKTKNSYAAIFNFIKNLNDENILNKKNIKSLIKNSKTIY